MSKRVVNKYRKAAKKLWGANDAEAKHYIRDPKDDPGESAPKALAIIYMEANGTFPEDQFTIPDRLNYYGKGFENAGRLGDEAGEGFVEFINAAVAAVWPS